MTRSRINEKPTAPGRPESFDHQVLQYQPGLTNLAKRLISHRDRDRARELQADLVTDTIILALHRWASFRPDGGMWLWLSLTMRSLARDRRVQMGKEIVTVDDPDGILAGRAGMAPRQEGYAELSKTLSKMTGRAKDMVLRRAAGEGLAEIANDNGISKQRVQQIIERERERVRGVSCG